MWLRSGGPFGTGGEIFAHGVTASAVFHADAGTFVLGVTRAGGGVMAFRIEEDGGLTLADSRLFPEPLDPLLTGKLAIVETATGPMVFVGAGRDHLVGYRITEDGPIGARVEMAHEAVLSEIESGNDLMLRALALHSDTAPLPDGNWQTDTLAFERAGSDPDAPLVTISAFDDHVTVIPGAGASGIAHFGAEQGFGIAAPAALELIESDLGHWAVLAAAGSSSLSVLAVTPDGGVLPTDHVIDTRGTRFEDVQALASARWGDEVLIVAGGSDHGLTLFRLSPDGRLVWLDTLEHQTGDGLYNISALSALVIDQTLVVTAGSQRDPGLTTVTVSLADLGISGHLATGGAGHDLLISSSGNTVLTGGAEADIFALRVHGAPVEITDFQVGIDRLDLSDWPMLRSVDQLDIMTTSEGALVTYRDFSIRVASDHGGGLTAEEIFPGGLQGPDRMFFLSDPFAGNPDPEDDAPAPPEPEPAPPVPAGSRILDFRGRGVSEATITLTPPDGAPVITQSDADGHFSLPPAAEGALSLTRFHTAADPAITAADALNILRLAVGLDDWAAPLDFIAADIDRNGRVTASDALEVLRIAVGLTPKAPPEWVFIDARANLDAINARDVDYATDIRLDGSDIADLSVTAILLGNVDGAG